MFKKFRQFKSYLKESLCPSQLTTEWGFWGNIATYVAYLALKSRAYPYQKQDLPERWRKFAGFIFINSMDKEDGWDGKPIPAHLLGSYAGAYLKALASPMYFLWLLGKVSSLKARDIYYPFLQGNES